MSNVHTAKLTERAQIVPLALITDVENVGALTGDFIKVGDFSRATFLFYKDPGTAGQDATMTFLQSVTDGGATKALNLRVAGAVDKKQAATSLANVGRFSDASAGVANNTWTDAANAEECLLLAVDVRPEDLDIENGYKWVQVTIADVGAGTGTQWVAAFAILEGPRFGGAVDEMPVAITTS